MAVDLWIVQDYSTYKGEVVESDNLVHYFTRQLDGKGEIVAMIVVAKCAPEFSQVTAAAMKKDTTEGSDYLDYKTKYIDTERSVKVINSLDADMKLLDVCI